MNVFDHDVAIVGSGPAGIAAATALSNAGVTNIVVYEREAGIGGIPRHTLHPSFGLLVFKRPMSGPRFIRALVARCSDVQFRTNTTILAIRPGGELDLATPAGIRTIRARHIVLATGAREMPRHPRLVSGLRPQGVMTTGALQQFVHGAKLRPFARPIIVGTELVSFSALWTLRSAGITPVAMIEENPRITAYRPAALFARLMRVPIHYDTRITDIGDIEVTRHVFTENTGGESRQIACDGVIFSGRFVGENTLARASHLELNPATQLPLVDQNWLSSDPAISIIGNSVHPADMGDQCYGEGLHAGRAIADLLAGNSAPAGLSTVITHDNRVKMTTPSFVRTKDGDDTTVDLSLHVTKPFTGSVSVSYGGQVVYNKSHRCMPARRVTLKNIRLVRAASGSDPGLKILLKDHC